MYQVSEGLEAALSLLEPDLRRRRIEVKRQYQPTPDLFCRARDLNQVFFHLLQNAMDAIGPAERAGEIVVRAEAKDGAIVAAIEDNGIGISQENRRRSRFRLHH